MWRIKEKGKGMTEGGSGLMPGEKKPTERKTVRKRSGRGRKRESVCERESGVVCVVGIVVRW